MADTAEDPRARFRHLPEPVRLEDVVETSDATSPPPAEQPLEEVWRTAMLGSGTP